MKQAVRPKYRWIAMKFAWVWPLLAAGFAQAQASPEATDAPADTAVPPGDDKATTQAREHFQRGTEYYREGDYRSAYVEFERAYALRRAYRLLYNLGQTAYELRDYAAAERHFRAYLVEGENEITAERRAEITMELAKLRERVSSVTVRTDPPGATVQIDERAVGTTPFAGPIRVSAGRRRIVAELPGRPQVSRVVDVVGGERVEVDLKFGPPLVAASGDAAGAQAGTNWVPWLTGIASGVFAIGAVGFGVAAYQDSSDYEDKLKGFTNREQLEVLSSNAQDKALVADVLLGAALLGTTVTLILLATGGDENPASERASTGPTAF
jgi:tetratricopeptide (TPR) repeat protein